MPRIDWIEQRLLNWARWVLASGGSSGPGGYSSTSWAGSSSGGGRDGYREAVIPISDVEASETDQAVNRLSPGGLALTVREFYTGKGGVAEKATRLCIGESTLHARIDQAHRQLAEHFLAQQDRQRAERERVEAVQASARPGSFTP